MKRTIALLPLLFLALVLSAQPNCRAYLYYGDSLKARACEQCKEIAGHYQFSRDFQEALDKAIEIDSTFYYPYQTKSIAYLKSGDFITWKKLIDKAVKYYPEGSLGYRGWCRYQFFRDYEGALKDLEELESIVDYDIGFSVNGDYHLKVAKAIILKNLNRPNEAIELIEEQLTADNYDPGLYDYLHLGVLYLEKGEINKAIDALKKQNARNHIAEGEYYLALAYKSIGETSNFRTAIAQSKELYLKDSRMLDPYTRPTDKVYLEWIEQELK